MMYLVKAFETPNGREICKVKVSEKELTECLENLNRYFQGEYPNFCYKLTLVTK